MALPIETARLTLRTFVESDLDALHDLHSRDDVARYMYWEPWTRGRAVEALGRRMQNTRLDHEGDSVSLAVVRRIIGRCDAANTASARLMGRLGMRHEAHLVDNEFVKGVWASEDDFAMLADEWTAER